MTCLLNPFIFTLGPCRESEKDIALVVHGISVWKTPAGVEGVGKIKGKRSKNLFSVKLNFAEKLTNPFNNIIGIALSRKYSFITRIVHAL